MNDIESQEQAAPLNPSRYIRNRTLFAIFDVCLLLLNSFWVHGRVSHAIIDVPSITFIAFVRQLENSTKTMSDSLVAQIDAANVAVLLEINVTLQNESSRADGILALNQIKVRARQEDEQRLRYAYHQKVIYLQSWSRVGNTVPYKPNTTIEDQLALQAMLNLENGAIIEELSGDSMALSTQVSARYKYDLEYLHNKTLGLIPSLIPDISASLQIPDLDLDIRESVIKTFNDLTAELRPIREYISNVYSSISLQLLETELAFQTVALQYDTLVNTIRQFYEILDGINVIGIDTSVFPRVDLDSFPPPNLYLPDSITFPELDIFLKPFDDVLLRLEAPFDLLAAEIFDGVNIHMDMKIDEIMAIMVDALTPDDYFPPSIIIQGRSMSLPDALLLNSEITANLTMQANQLPNPPMLPEAPDTSVPTVDYEPQNFDFAQPVADLFSWSIPNLNPFVSFLREILIFLWLHYMKVDAFVVNTYRAMCRLLQYFEGTAVPLPVIDLRTKVEQEDGVIEKQSKCKTISSYLFHPLVGIMVTRLIPFLIFAGFVFVGYNYYFGEFHPNCIMSSKGTSVGNFAVGPFLYNRALAAGQQHAIDLSIRNHIHVEETCQVHSINALNYYRQQIVDFEGSRIKAFRNLQGLDALNDIVDLSALCAQHKLACEGTDPNFRCPVLADGSIISNPCIFVATDTHIDDATLEAVDFSCAAVPRGQLSLNGARGQVQEVLMVEENWCIIEWSILSHIWRIVYVITGYIVLGQAFFWTIEGLHTYLWTYLRPEWWYIKCTADRNGVFTQPEYSDQAAKADAIREWQFGNNCMGIGKIIVGVALIAGWVVVSFATWRMRMVPLWYNGATA